MTLAIAMIGFAPTYAAIGIAAPLLIVFARLLQGFSAGGDFASCTAFLIDRKTLGLTMPATLPVAADEVIE
jgi:MFS transporter, MHS family, proline/betaine transporter